MDMVIDTLWIWGQGDLSHEPSEGWQHFKNIHKIHSMSPCMALWRLHVASWPHQKPPEVPSNHKCLPFASRILLEVQGD